jgi:hypothetical protein
MSERIRLLEEALENVEADNPLLDPQLLNVKSTMGLYGPSQTGEAAINGSATPNNPAGPQRPGSSSGHLTPVSVGVCGSPCSLSTQEYTMQSPQELDAEILRLSHTFPMTGRVGALPNANLREYARSRLPPPNEATYLWEQTKKNALWQ